MGKHITNEIGVYKFWLTCGRCNDHARVSTLIRRGETRALTVATTCSLPCSEVLLNLVRRCVVELMRGRSRTR